MTALDMSISVNVFSETADLLAFYRLQKVYIGFLARTTDTVRREWKAYMG